MKNLKIEKPIQYIRICYLQNVKKNKYEKLIFDLCTQSEYGDGEEGD